jgi:aspartate/methionine/tyrosine aminotransferase
MSVVSKVRVGSPIREADQIVAELRRQGKTITSLSIGDPATYFKTPENIIDAYVKALRDSKTSYSSSLGILELRDAVAKRQTRLYGGSLTGNEVLVTQGASEGIDFINRALIDPGDTAVLFRPYYPSYLAYLNLAGGRALLANYSEESNWGVDIEGLERAIKKAPKGKKPKYLMVINPNNPTGTVLKEEDLKQIVGLAKKYGLLLVSDEIYDEIVYNGAKFTSVSTLAKGIPHIIINGASKCYDSTGLRIGFLIIPEHDRVSVAIRERIADIASIRLCPNTPSQYAMVEALNNVDEHSRAIARMRDEIAARVTFAAEMINNSEHMKTVKPDGGFYAFPKLHMGKLDIRSDGEFVTRLLQEECIQVARGSGFGAPDHIRIVALAEKAVLEKAISRIEALCKRLSK